MREGWICARCKASVSPDERTCPGCSAATASAASRPVRTAMVGNMKFILTGPDSAYFNDPKWNQ